jgi:hypothetical protein
MWVPAPTRGRDTFEIKHLARTWWGWRGLLWGVTSPPSAGPPQILLEPVGDRGPHHVGRVVPQARQIDDTPGMNGFRVSVRQTVFSNISNA